MRHLTTFDTNSLLAALEELIPTGIFDTVDNVFGSIQCLKGGELVITFSASGAYWSVTPYLNTSTAATGNHIVDTKILVDGYICAQGLYLRTRYQDSRLNSIIITKGSNGNAVTLVTVESSETDLVNPIPCYVTSYGDDTSTTLYTSGYKIPGIATGTTAADRTQLLKLPICGQQGSTDYITGCQGILLRQYTDPGIVEIDGVRYFCINRLAIVDE